MASSWPIRWGWTPYLLASLAKVLVLRYGGARLYGRTIPLAAGLAVGAYIGQGLRAIAAFII